MEERRVGGVLQVVRVEAGDHVLHFGGCNSRELAQLLKRKAVSACRAFSSRAACSAPGGSSEALWRVSLAKEMSRS